ncbi:MAG: chlorophyll synthesis pathway protein BchC [Pseudomonadota bacterium]
MITEARAVVFEQPGVIAMRPVELAAPGDGDCVVDIEFSGVSTGTERLLWDGRMPAFPGLAYPLVPGYESVGRVSRVTNGVSLTPGQRVFVPGSRGFTNVNGLFGGASSRLVVAEDRLIPIDDALGEEGTLLALAATALHALGRHGENRLPELVVGHGVLGRLMARLLLALGQREVVVWESSARRREGALGYTVVDPADDLRSDYDLICDVSGDTTLLDTLISRLRPGGAVLLAGFYNDPLSFAFPPAFMREIQLTIAAEWQPEDLARVKTLITEGRLSLGGLISHRASPIEAEQAYRTAFGDPDCLKMILDWSSH